ncbi:MAG TPA: hypothetical protein VHO03_05865 [Ignavibacteriales bacterium]|nr:hypothetical protein [Ignavibacteriales bacterium]
MITDFFDTEIQVLRKTQTESGGVVKNSFTPQATAQGKNTVIGSREAEENSRRGFVTTHRTYMAVVDVKNGDKFLINGEEFEVKDVRNPMGLNKFLQVDSELKS